MSYTPASETRFDIGGATRLTSARGQPFPPLPLEASPIPPLPPEAGPIQPLRQRRGAELLQISRTKNANRHTHTCTQTHSLSMFQTPHIPTPTHHKVIQQFVLPDIGSTFVFNCNYAIASSRERGFPFSRKQGFPFSRKQGFPSSQLYLFFSKNQFSIFATMPFLQFAKLFFRAKQL